MTHLAIRTLIALLLTVTAGIIIPGNTPPAAEAMVVEGVTTCDVLDNPKTVFAPGDAIRYNVNFTTSLPFTLVFFSGKVEGNDLQENLPCQNGIVSPGAYTIRWDSTVPESARGIATVRILPLAIIGGISVVEATFTITPAPSDNVGSKVCMACHSAVYESLKDSSHAFIECESCHGPGGAHIAAPSADTITVDKSSALCGQCHTRGDSQHRIAAEGGLLKRNQQYDELLGGGKSFLRCIQCHDPHISLASETQDPITADCSSCHSQTINRIHAAAGIECIDCHMPYAVKKETSSGEGDYLKGDSRTHLFTINATAQPSEMFYPQSGKTFANEFITLNFVCLGCHNGVLAREQEFEWAVQAAPLIHSQ